eukprot:GHVP01070562.1.p1 GENE.GHVP01070562.1~~GHVP01070562.1.p1  ORF type:complete len:238 (+),score=64.26 GHVP01070562.1:50-715(+)
MEKQFTQFAVLPSSMFEADEVVPMKNFQDIDSEKFLGFFREKVGEKVKKFLSIFKNSKPQNTFVHESQGAEENIYDTQPVSSERVGTLSTQSEAHSVMDVVPGCSPPQVAAKSNSDVSIVLPKPQKASENFDDEEELDESDDEDDGPKILFFRKSFVEKVERKQYNEDAGVIYVDEDEDEDDTVPTKLPTKEDLIAAERRKDEEDEEDPMPRCGLQKATNA